MTYTEIKKVFDDLKISAKNGIWKISGNRVDSSIISTCIAGRLTDITPDEAIKLFTNPPTSGEYMPVLTGVRRHAPIHSSKFDSISWNSVDDYLFSRFFYSVNPIDGSVMLLVQSSDDEYKPILLGGNRTTQLSTLASICGTVYVDNDQTLGAWLTSMVNLMNERMIDRCMHIFNDSSISQVNKIPSIIDYLTTKYSASIIAGKYTPNVLYISTEIDGKAVMTPISMRVVNEAMRGVNIFEHILDSVDELVKRPEKRIDMPTPYSTIKGVKTFRYLDLDSLIKHGDTPAWDFYLTRYTSDEAEVLKAYIFSIFESRNKTRQLLYIYDNGFTGKSSLINAISAYLGDETVASIQKDSLNNQFGLAKVWDKRLVTIDDNKNTKILRGEKMHMMLGGGRGDIEMKGKNSFSAKFDLKVIVSGNVLPEIDTAATHELTRIIIIKPRITNEILEQIAAKNPDGSIRYDSYGKPVMVGDDGFSAKLKSEMGKFLGKCELSYKKLCPTHASIILPDSLIDEVYTLQSDESVQMDAMANAMLDFHTTHSVLKSDLFSWYMEAASSYSLETTSNAYANFIAHLSKDRDIKSIRPRPSRIPTFTGVRIKPQKPPVTANITRLSHVLGEEV